jgi:hypothetical protein
VVSGKRPNLSIREAQKVEVFNNYFQGIFATKMDDYALTGRVFKRIDTEDARPFSQPPRRLELVKQARDNETL